MVLLPNLLGGNPGPMATAGRTLWVNPRSVKNKEVNPKLLLSTGGLATK